MWENVWWMATSFCSWFIHSGRSGLFFCPSALSIFNASLGSTVTLTTSICPHLRSLLACAEPRRALASRGDAALEIHIVRYRGWNNVFLYTVVPANASIRFHVYPLLGVRIGARLTRVESLRGQNIVRTSAASEQLVQAPRLINVISSTVFCTCVCLGHS